jgi:hypothetical protein
VPDELTQAANFSNVDQRIPTIKPRGGPVCAATTPRFQFAASVYRIDRTIAGPGTTGRRRESGRRPGSGK